MDASNLLKPTLASGELRCIGSTTYQEYKRSFDRDKALARRFQRIDVLEPTQVETVQILDGLKSYYEKHHNVRYTAPALRSAVELSARYINDRFLPDKAIDVMDEAGVAGQLRGKGADKGGSVASMDMTAVIEPGDAPGACVLFGTSVITVSGKLAQFGGRMLGQVSDLILNQFVDNFRAVASGRAEGAAGAEAGGARPAPESRELDLVGLLWALIKAWFGRLFGRRA